MGLSVCACGKHLENAWALLSPDATSVRFENVWSIVELKARRFALASRIILILRGQIRKIRLKLLTLSAVHRFFVILKQSTRDLLFVLKALQSSTISCA